EVWGAGSEQENNALWTLVSRLRKKLRSDESRLEIASLRGGYLLEQL
ncbi:helix-turn-helix domain-containing protein, partial [Allofournierella sp.]